MGERMSYEVHDLNGGFMIDNLHGHLLFIAESPTAVHRAHFVVEDEFGVLTTARAFDAYPRDAHPTDPNHVVVEVGAGLGGFIPALARRHQGQLVVIDPFDYTMAKEMLEFAEQLSLNDWQRSHVEDLLDRCGIYLDSSRVHLVSSRLDEALAREPSLAASADLVVDYYGAMQFTFPGGSSESHVRDLECRMLRPSGVLVAKRNGGFPLVIRP